MTLAIALLSIIGLVQSAAAQDFTPEPIGKIEQLPSTYPDHWLVVHDAAFFHMGEGKLLVVDPLGENVGAQFKGMMTSSLIGHYQSSTKRNEHYVIETFYSRGGRGGNKSDVVTIYDNQDLAVQAEIIIPAKRLSGMPKTSATALLDGEKFLLVYNFTPAQSVSVVNLETRDFVTEIPTPGCGFVLPATTRSFSSLCSNGTLLTTHLTEDGQLERKDQSKALYSAEDDPVFEAPVQHNGTAYFATFAGQILPVDLTRKQLKVRRAFWMTEGSERNWRPGGIRPSAGNNNGLAYYLMNPEGGEGTHKDGGSEVWVFDLKKRKRTARIPLKTWGLAVGVSGNSERRLLAVTNAEMQVDIYQLDTGTYLRTLDIAAETPFLVHGVAN